jgi:hypothetical protein
MAKDSDGPPAWGRPILRDRPPRWDGEPALELDAEDSGGCRTLRNLAGTRAVARLAIEPSGAGSAGSSEPCRIRQKRFRLSAMRRCWSPRGRHRRAPQPDLRLLLTLYGHDPVKYFRIKLIGAQCSVIRVSGAGSAGSACCRSWCGTMSCCIAGRLLQREPRRAARRSRPATSPEAYERPIRPRSLCDARLTDVTPPD